VKTSRSRTPANLPPKGRLVPGPSAALATAKPGWTTFWFSAADPIALHRIRFLAGLLFLSWLLPLIGHQTGLFSLSGWLDDLGYREVAALPGAPAHRVGWSLVYLFGTSTAAFHVFWWLAIAVLVLFTLGVATRVTAVLTWLVVASLLATPASFDADFLLAMLAFYLMIGYMFLGVWSALSGDAEAFRAGFFWRNASADAPSHAANLALRLIQVHFAIVMVTSGLTKLQFGDWWSGMGLWYRLHPPYDLDADKLRALAQSKWLSWFVHSSVQYPVLVWQIAFPVFAWRGRLWRIVLLGGGVLSWLGCAFIYGEPLFGPMYLIGCLSYLRPAEWRWLQSWVPVGRRNGHAAFESAAENKPALGLAGRS
jgi:hypothetical protein